MRFRPKRSTAAKREHGQASPVLQLFLKHGDVVVQAGSGIQVTWEHAVNTKGPLRVAATARCMNVARVPMRSRPGPRPPSTELDGRSPGDLGATSADQQILTASPPPANLNTIEGAEDNGLALPALPPPHPFSNNHEPLGVPVIDPLLVSPPSRSLLFGYPMGASSPCEERAASSKYATPNTIPCSHAMDLGSSWSPAPPPPARSDSLAMQSMLLTSTTPTHPNYQTLARLQRFSHSLETPQADSRDGPYVHIAYPTPPASTSDLLGHAAQDSHMAPGGMDFESACFDGAQPSFNHSLYTLHALGPAFDDTPPAQ